MREVGTASCAMVELSGSDLDTDATFKGWEERTRNSAAYEIGNGPRAWFAISKPEEKVFPILLRENGFKEIMDLPRRGWGYQPGRLILWVRTFEEEELNEYRKEKEKRKRADLIKKLNSDLVTYTAHIDTLKKQLGEIDEQIKRENIKDKEQNVEEIKEEKKAKKEPENEE